MKGFTEIIGKVEGEFVTEEKNTVAKEPSAFGTVYEKEENRIARYLDISLF